MAHHHGSHHHDHDHGDHDHGQSEQQHDTNVLPLAHGAGVGMVLHFDCFSGVAGDMVVASLLDLGVPREPIDRALAALPIEGYRVALSTRTQSGIIARRFMVHVEGVQPDRTFRDIRAMLGSAPLLDGVRSRALSTFELLARAEGRVHRMPREDVQFHEVGAVDAIVDVVAASAALDWLGARVTCSPLPMGRGFVRAAHGVLPVPAPAVVEILQGAPTVDAPVDSELVTPTGASIVRSNASEWTRWPSIRPMASGFGAGSRTLPDRPNMLRVVLGAPDATGVGITADGTHVVLETNIDDASGQIAAHVTDRLLRDGALDAWTTQVGMKKGRPGVMISALARRADHHRIGAILLEESGSLGLRWRTVDRVERARRAELVETSYGSVPMKVADGDGLSTTAQPEFDVCRELARIAGVPVRAVHSAAIASWLSTRRQT